MNKPVRKHRDEGDTLYHMMDEILVECPRCHTCARHNSRLVNRLPEWMILAKHREAVLSAITRLRRENCL